MLYKTHSSSATSSDGSRQKQSPIIGCLRGKLYRNENKACLCPKTGNHVKPTHISDELFCPALCRFNECGLLISVQAGDQTTRYIIRCNIIYLLLLSVRRRAVWAADTSAHGLRSAVIRKSAFIPYRYNNYHHNSTVTIIGLYLSFTT